MRVQGQCKLRFCVITMLGCVRGARAQGCDGRCKGYKGRCEWCQGMC